MQTIRRIQLDALALARFRSFVERMCRHLRTEFGEEVGEMNEAELRHAVESGISRARAYGLRSAQDLCRFLNLCAVFGWEFDEDESLREVLTDDAVENASVRLRRVYARCLRRLEVEEHNERLWAETAVQ